MNNFAIGSKYTVRNREGEIIKRNCTLQTIIGEGQVLTEKQVLDYYFKGDLEKMETSMHTEQILKTRHKNPKLVFDNCVIPVTDRYIILEE